MEYDWKIDKYIDLVEKSDNSFLQEYMKAELDYIINKIANPEEKIFIDVGAGYGRVLPQLSEIAKQVLAVELDKQMLSELRKRASRYQNISVVECDAQELSNNLKDFNLDKAVVLCFQNSLGTPYGDAYKIISEMAEIAKNNKGELFISLFNQEALKDYGISIYSGAAGLTGEPDLEKTDFLNGNFISKTGYKSHWWTPKERSEMVESVGGSLVAEVKGRCFYIFHVKYS